MFPAQRGWRILRSLVNLGSTFSILATAAIFSVTRGEKELAQEANAVFNKTQLNIYCLGLAGHGEM